MKNNGNKNIKQTTILGIMTMCGIEFSIGIRFLWI